MCKIYGKRSNYFFFRGLLRTALGLVRAWLLRRFDLSEFSAAEAGGIAARLLFFFLRRFCTGASSSGSELSKAEAGSAAAMAGFFFLRDGTAVPVVYHVGVCCAGYGARCVPVYG